MGISDIISLFGGIALFLFGMTLMGDGLKKAAGEKLDEISDGAEDAAFVQTICRAMFERSARGMCTNLAAILLLSGEKKANVCAEGSLVQRSRAYRPALERLLREEIGGKLGLEAELTLGNESTLPGSAAAAQADNAAALRAEVSFGTRSKPKCLANRFPQQ